MPHSTLPDPLVRLIQDHGARYAPHYPPVDNSDHGPMAYLAMHGLGIAYPRIESFSQTYQTRLVSAPPPMRPVSTDRWAAHVGVRESYMALREFFIEQISKHGWQTTTAEYLPRLISGWVKDAFHPLIRLAYGIEFEAVSEIASGLAYLTIVGDDPELARIAQRPPTNLSGRDYLIAAQTMRMPAFARGPFNVRYQRILREAPLTAANDEPMDRLSRACLEVFHKTHDFFALHLVTASHAFRVCEPWAGRAGGLFSTGIAAAYLAIGAPQFDPLARAAAALPIERLSSARDEHDIKLAFSARSQALAYGDPTYEWAAAAYLNTRLPATT